MDASLYKDTVTSRGLTYRYYFSPAQPSKPTLLFCHGFPSTSHDWRHICLVLKDKGYGVLVLDMLGYGKTDKPTDPAAYVPSLISRDIVDVLDVEKLAKVIAIGHDWGSKVVSRLANYYPERFLAYAFFAVPFVQIRPPMDMQVLLDASKQKYGYELFGYWLFLSEPDANDVLQAHIGSFISIFFPHDPALFRTHLAPTGALKQSLLDDFAAPRPPYLSEADAKRFVETFRRNGFAAPTCWYKVMTTALSADDDQQISPERRFPPASAPIFYGAAKHDYVCLPENGYAAFGAKEFGGHSVTTREYDADHWLILSRADEIVRDLETWIEGTVLAKA
ncbi:uncharacterized protein PHACADRAFT_151144 [Phanerochaete carnosa HHB-10118-sp]|uniref:AB hydrolase-1 domain-containing protein n=1 Tax=Phanerochaete carnosa (strain HHB-10118-sp) TaxID=650164 RepID=K5VL46_PHACS|nr:uncharacterized protein PHACADRAFT_151144 [Phanerochaete carnosa HHB-10118-sp]EKM52143.1 hypothetical protein PHACADRAFT_151144 [Phanerochaete carnosa HHB-10118-sp]